MAGTVGVEEIKGGRLGLDFFFAGGQEPQPTIIQGLMGPGAPKGLKFRAVDQFVMNVPSAREDFPGMAKAMLSRVAETTKAAGPLSNSES